MSNFGFSRLRVVNPYEKAFRTARSAVGAAELLASAEEYDSVADAIADCTLVVGTTAVRHRAVQHPLRRLEYGGRLIRKHMSSGPVALLFGSERYGLSKEDLSHCHWLIRIPTREQNISMNLGQAVAICLYELIRDSRAAGKAEKQALATGGDIERITALLGRCAEHQQLHASAAGRRNRAKNSPHGAPPQAFGPGCRSMAGHSAACSMAVAPGKKEGRLTCPFGILPQRQNHLH